jgi:DNA-binding transcriptional LysR family regulator
LSDLHSVAVDPELRLLRYFVAVAEELNFTRAAQRLHMAQQPLSAAIARLEVQLSAELFVRTTRSVALTDAGRALLEPARAALQAADDAYAAGRAGGHGQVGELVIGLSPGARYELEPLFAALRRRHPGIRLRVRQASSRPLLNDVLAGELDLAIGMCVHVTPDLVAQRLKDEPVVVAVAVGHPLAARQRVPIEDLRDETFALDDPLDGPDYNAAVISLCARHGFTPTPYSGASYHDAWEDAVVQHRCVGFTTRSAVQAAHRDIRLLELDPASTFPLDLLWRPNLDHELRPVLRAFLTLAAGVTANERWLKDSE